MLLQHKAYFAEAFNQGMVKLTITELATVPIYRGSLLPSPAEESGSVFGTGTEQKVRTTAAKFP